MPGRQVQPTQRGLRSARLGLTPRLSLQLKMILIKCCDISNEVRPMEVAEPWVDCLLEEYFMQVRVCDGTSARTAVRPPGLGLAPGARPSVSGGRWVTVGTGGSAEAPPAPREPAPRAHSTRDRETGQPGKANAVRLPPVTALGGAGVSDFGLEIKNCRDRKGPRGSWGSADEPGARGGVYKLLLPLRVPVTHLTSLCLSPPLRPQGTALHTLRSTHNSIVFSNN